MDRSETKYLLPIAAVPELLTTLSNHYRILTIDGTQEMFYRSLYLDTAAFGLYRAHHNRRAWRYKVRLRTYEQTNVSFLEVKERFATGRTAKTRIQLRSCDFPLDPIAKAFLRDKVRVEYDFEAKLSVRHPRTTLVGEGRAERVTFDRGIEFFRPDDMGCLRLDDVVVVELKRASFRQWSPLHDYMRTHGVHEGTFSKYGLGCSMLHPVKRNAFKPQFLASQRLGRWSA